MGPRLKYRPREGRGVRPGHAKAEEPTRQPSGHVCEATGYPAPGGTGPQTAICELSGPRRKLSRVSWGKKRVEGSMLRETRRGHRDGAAAEVILLSLLTEKFCFFFPHGQLKTGTRTCITSWSFLASFC